MVYLTGKLALKLTWDMPIKQLTERPSLSHTLASKNIVVLFIMKPIKFDLSNKQFRNAKRYFALKPQKYFQTSGVKKHRNAKKPNNLLLCKVKLSAALSSASPWYSSRHNKGNTEEYQST